MIQGISAALSALTAGQQRMDALAYDTANVNTTGYRAAGRESLQGPIYDTGEPLDLAIEGNGAFQLAGGRTTRDGSFQLDASAQIVTSSGASLLPPVQLPPGTDAPAPRPAPPRAAPPPAPPRPPRDPPPRGGGGGGRRPRGRTPPPRGARRA